jgi:hypothetical protein
MKTLFQFRSQLQTRGEILAHPVAFLPVERARPPQTGELYTREMQHLAGFLPVFNFKRKNLTVAQPLLKEDLR